MARNGFREILKFRWFNKKETVHLQDEQVCIGVWNKFEQQEMSSCSSPGPGGTQYMRNKPDKFGIQILDG